MRRRVLDARLDLDGDGLAAVGDDRLAGREVGCGLPGVRRPAVELALGRLGEILVVGLVVPVAGVEAVDAAGGLEDRYLAALLSGTALLAAPTAACNQRGHQEN